MKVSKSIKIGSALGAGAIVVSTAGVAIALWSATGSGDGNAKAYTAQAITASVVASPTADDTLYPGGPGSDVNFTVDNPNPYDVSFTGWSGASVTGVTGGSGTCVVGDFSVPATGSFASPLSIPSGTTSQAASLAGALTMDSTVSGTDCQGATVKVSFTLAGGSQA